MRLEEGEKVVAREECRLGVLERRRRRGARAAIEQRELSEEVTGAHDRDERLLTELAWERDLHRTVQDDIEMHAGIVLAEEHLSTLERARAHPLSKLRDLGVRELGEQRIAPQMLR